jgi:hypothetical protein
MYRSGNANLRDYGDYIARALQTEGGHLSVGSGGFILWFGCGARLSGYEHIEASRIAAGLPVIDSRIVVFEDVARLAVRGPMVAIGEEASPPPYHALSFAPLRVVAQACRAAGVEVFNLPDPAEPAAEE